MMEIIRRLFARQRSAERIDPPRHRGRLGSARVAILTITLEEFAATQKVFSLSTNVSGSAYFVQSPVPNGDYDVVLRRAAAQGNIESARCVGGVMEDFRPHFILLVGTAGGSGKDDGQAGDVVVPDIVEYYEHRKYVGGRDLARRTPGDQPSLFLRERFIEPLRVSGAWMHLVPSEFPRPVAGAAKIIIGELVAGEKLLGDASNAYQAKVFNEFDKAVAVDMESWGVAKEVFQHRSTPGYNPQYLVVRGISDLVSSPVNDDMRVKWRDHAAAAAAAVAFCMVKSLLETTDAGW